MAYQNTENRLSGFTLVELSIVLIIIGFIIAGISAGTSLVKSAEINSVIGDFRSYQTAYNNFVGRYNAAPGDMNNASTIWSTAIGGSCNGNNDGVIGASTATTGGLEIQGAMAQLAAAGMVGYSPTTSFATCTSIAMTANTLPSSKAPGGLYSIINGSNIVVYQTTTAPTPVRNSGLWNTTFAASATSSVNAVLLGKANSSATVPANTPVYQAINASSIDTKVDDGVPGTGSVRGTDGAGSAQADCVTITSGVTSYTVGSTATGCIIAMQLS